MRTSTLILVFHLVCLEFVSLANASSVSQVDTTSSLIGRTSLWSCSSDAECTVNNSSCVTGYCQCAGGYIYNTDSTACLQAATAYGDSCTETLQCSAYLLSGATCEDEVCVCGKGYHYTRGRCYPSSGLGETCSTDVQCYVNADTEALSCVGGVCVCSDGFYQREYRTCRRIGYAEGDECAINLDCQFENGVCSNSFVCTTSATTASKNSLDDFAKEEDEEEETSRLARSLSRVDETVLIGSKCTSNDDCDSISYSVCGPAGTCICERAYYASSDSSTCLPEIGEDCISNDTVRITNSLCRNGTWSCGYSTVASINQKVCRKTTKSYSFSCVYDEQCNIFGPDSSCQERKCLCNEGSHFVDDYLFCWVSKGIGETCQANEDCYVEGLGQDLTCTNSVCTCPNGTTANSANTLCKSINTELGSVCEEDDDCTIANSACINSVCACSENYFMIDDYCGAGINATCTSDSDCTVSNTTCTEDNVCNCVENFVATDSNFCLPTASYGEECEFDVQCSAALSNSYCSMQATTISEDEGSNVTEITTSSCECKSDYHYRFGSCNQKTVIGNSCNSLRDCYVESGMDEVVCRKGVCACSWDSSATETSCSRVASNSSIFFLSTWMSLIIFGLKLALMIR